MESTQGGKVADQCERQVMELTGTQHQLAQRQADGESTERVLVKSLSAYDD